MNYNSGDKIEVGDTVMLWRENLGVVVCSIDDDVFSVDFPKNDWQYLEHGILISSEQAGLIHITSCNEDLVLIKKAK